MRRDSRKTTAKIAASVVLVGAAAAVAGLGTFGSFTSSTSASEAVSSGTVVLNSAGGVQGMTVAANNLVPGDTVQRSAILTRANGSETFGSVKLTTTAGTNNILTSDASNGLQMKIDSCPTAWTKGSTMDLTCAGGSTSVVAQRPVVGSNLDLGSVLADLNGASKTSNLRVTLTLPTTADNSFQGLSNTINFNFDATQRAAESR